MTDASSQPSAAKVPDPLGPRAGLTSDEARRRLQAVGPNAMPDTTPRALRSALGKLWAPVPWMLEAAIVLQVLLGKNAEAAIIATLLVFNAALGWFQESRAQATLAALRSRLALSVSVRRDDTPARWSRRLPSRCSWISSKCLYFAACE